MTCVMLRNCTEPPTKCQVKLCTSDMPHKHHTLILSNLNLFYHIYKQSSNFLILLLNNEIKWHKTNYIRINIITVKWLSINNTIPLYNILYYMIVTTSLNPIDLWISLELILSFLNLITLGFEAQRPKFSF